MPAMQVMPFYDLDKQSLFHKIQLNLQKSPINKIEIQLNRQWTLNNVSTFV